MGSNTLRALVLAIVPIAACSTFGAEDEPQEAATDAGSVTPGSEGGSDGGVPSDEGGTIDAGACAPIAVVRDGFERQDLPGTWDAPVLNGGGTLALETIAPLEDLKSLKVELPSGSKKDAYLGRPLETRACVVDVAFLFKAVVLGSNTNVRLLEIELAGTQVVLLLDMGTIYVRELSAGSPATKTPLGGIVLGTPYRIALRVDTLKKEMLASVGPVGTSTSTVVIPSTLAHTTPTKLRFGAAGAESNVQFHYLVDRFDLR